MNILIKIPCRGRPKKFKETILKYQNQLSNKHNVNFIFSFDNDDLLMNSDDIKQFLNQFNNVTYFYGNNKNKILSSSQISLSEVIDDEFISFFFSIIWIFFENFDF